MNYSVCIPAVLRGLSEAEALHVVRKAGFSHYEIWSWWDRDMRAYREAQERENLSLAALCTYFEPLTDPARRKEYLEGLRKTAAVCHTLGCKTVITQVGHFLQGVSRGRQHDSIVEGLRACVPLLEGEGLTLVIEPLNTRIDHPGYYLWSAAEAFDMVDEVDSPQVKVLYDLYHQYVSRDLNMAQVLHRIGSIGHFHMAGYPGRHEPYHESEIDYDTILSALRDSAYAGCVGLEYMPVLPAEEGLCDLKKRLIET